MAKVMRTCIICGRKYSYCPQCGEDFGKPTWYFTFCSEGCKDIYGICTDWRDGEISTEEAAKELDKVDLTNLEDFTEVTKCQINEILKAKSVVTSERKANNTTNKFQKNK